jgi:hypothetical protein
MGCALRAGDQNKVILFAPAVGITAVLVILQRSAAWLLARHRKQILTGNRWTALPASGEPPAP